MKIVHMLATITLSWLLGAFFQRIQYAKAKSDCIAKAEGTYVPKEKKKKQEEKGNSFIF